MIVSPVAPLLHVYVTVPIPSSSVMLLETVRVPSSTAVPAIVTAPPGESLTLATALVAALVTDSSAPYPSV